MKIDVLTLFPAMFSGPMTESILKRAQDEGLLNLNLHDLREWGIGKHRQVDDEPYGGGAGMVMRVDVLAEAIEDVINGKKRLDDRMAGWFAKRVARFLQPSSHSAIHLSKKTKPHRILLSARGKTLTQEKVEELAESDHLLLLCGHYEGVDQRIVEGEWIDEEISIGEYVLTGGELPAMVLIDAVARHIPGVLGKEESAAEESYSKKLDRKREYPHYTRPEEFRGIKVPDVLRSGNHAEIERWRVDHLWSFTIFLAPILNFPLS